MEIYIEYALLQNFLFDYALLYLAAKAAKISTSKPRLIFSALLGAVFAVVVPLLRLYKELAHLLKFAMGFFMCSLLIKDLNKKNEWGRYALTSIFFFIFSFVYGGVLLAFTRDFFKERVPSALVTVGFAILTAFSVYLIGKLHKKREIYAYLYECEVIFQDKRIKAQGFWDSGNLAEKNCLPVCFLSPSLFYDLFEEEIFTKGEEHVCDELQIHTLGGIKKLSLYKGDLAVKTKHGEIKKQVYFAPSKNMLSRGYSLLLPSAILTENIIEEEK